MDSELKRRQASHSIGGGGVGLGLGSSTAAVSSPSGGPSSKTARDAATLGVAGLRNRGPAAAAASSSSSCAPTEPTPPGADRNNGSLRGPATLRAAVGAAAGIVGSSCAEVRGGGTSGGGPGSEPEPPDGENYEEEDEDGEDSAGGSTKDGTGAGSSGTEVVAGPIKPRNTLASVEWDEVWACPLTIRFTQDKIHPFFYRRGPIVDVLPKIRAVRKAGADINGEDYAIDLLPPFGSIHCLRRNGELWSLDNRRLYALQLAAIEHWPSRCSVRLLCRDRLPGQKFRTQYRKFSSTTEGRSIVVCARYQQFDRWSWVDRAVDYECYAFSQRLGLLFSAFEILPVIGALLFRTGLTGFASRMPLVIGFILTFACDLLRQRVPSLERRICELHVQAIIDGEVGLPNPCCQRMSQVRRRLMRVDEEELVFGPMSAPQLAVAVALVLILALPYVLGTTHGRLRSSMLSCWLGIACVLAVQLGGALRQGPPTFRDAEVEEHETPEVDGEGEGEAVATPAAGGAVEGSEVDGGGPG